MRKTRKKPRDSRRILLEQLEVRNLLAGDLDLSPHLLGEGEGPSCPAGFNYPWIAAYTGFLTTDVPRECFLQNAPTGSRQSAAANGELPPSQQPIFQFGESEPNDGLVTADVTPLGTGMGDSANVDVNATLSTAADTDVFRLNLDGGDVLHINIFGAAQTVTVLDANGLEMITSDMDANLVQVTIDTGEIRIPSGGNASLGVVIPRTGAYYVQITDADIAILGGAYTAQLRVQRPALENNPVGTHQILFLDFNGAVVDTAIWGGTGVASLSPLSTFMNSWGLAATDEDALIDAIIAKVEEDLGDEIRLNGENGDFLTSSIPGEFDIEIRNSRDHLDPFGEQNVSRIIIGGTIGELGIPTVGIAQSIDPGNLDPTESAVVLLDALSGQVGAGSTVDLNAIPVATGTTKIDLVAAGVAAVAAHEAGHYFGLWHTNNANTVANVIDSGGNIGATIGVGPDGIFGSPDDINTGFLTPDQYAPTEFFTGTEDTLNTLSWGLATGKLPSGITGVKFHDLNSNGVRDLTEPGLPGWTIFADLDGNGMHDLREPAAITGADGNYVLSVPPGQHTIREVLQPGWKQTFPTNGSHSVLVRPNESITNINFGNVALFGGISGTKFNDLDGDGVLDQGEPAVPGIIIYLDLDGDNRLDLGEPMARTDSKGNYSIAVPRTGTFTVREALQPGWEQTFPKNAEREHTITAFPGGSFPGLNFGNTSKLDYGDAPTAEQSGFAKSYPTTIADNGAVHAILPGFYLGAAIDGDPDGTPSVTATGDDVNTTINDEDGVVFDAPTIFPGSTAGKMTVNVSTNGYSPGRVNAWIDFNRDGDWDDAGEQIVTDKRASDGPHEFVFPVPANATSGFTYVRVRYGYNRNAKPTGSDTAGEIEDYRIRILSQTPVAVDDQFTITQGAGATTFDVLLNDLPSLSPPLTVIAAGATNVGQSARGGQVTVAANGSGVVYTPPSQFFGDDSFSYTIRDGAGNTDSADVRIKVLPSLINPLAVDDSFTVQAGSTNNQLAILANDLTGQNPPIGIVSFDNPTLGGSLVLDNRGTATTGDDTLVYTPQANFTGTDQFEYTVQDQNGKTAKATVTVHVNDAGDDRVRIRLQATDLNGNPIQAIGVGEEFNLQVLVADDLRPDDEDGNDAVDRFGVAAAYLDILYNFNLISLSSRTPFFGSDFQNATSISTSTPGLINEAGAFQTDQSNPLGRVCQINVPNPTCLPEANEFLLLTIPLRATAQGVADFKGDPADRRTNGPLTPPDHDVLLFNPAAPVPLEEIRYENDTLTILGSGGLPIAVDNTYHLAANSTNNVLDVLANDTEITNPPLTITATGILPGSPALQGSVSIASNGSAILYSPRTGFVGTEQFTYTATNKAGLTDQAVVTVQVGNSPKDINLRLETTDLNNNPISTIAAGSEFKVRAYVQDIRTSAPDPSRTGVFAIYFDLLYDAGLITTKNDPANRFGFGINFGSSFNVNGLSANNSFVNVIDEVGAFQSGSEALGSSEFLLTELTFRANTPGLAEFVADPADLRPFHDVLLFEPPAPVALDRVNLGVASITVLGAGAEGEFTNPQNRLDVNADGFVSPVDVVMIFNDLTKNGSRRLAVTDSGALGEGEGGSGAVRVPTGFVDTTGDGFVSPVDALAIINFLNALSLSEGEGHSVLVTNAAAGRSLQSTANSFVPSLVISTDRVSTNDSGQTDRDEPADSAPDPRALDTLFYHHRQTDSDSPQRDAHVVDVASEIVSEDLLDLLADRVVVQFDDLDA
ncbi:MAG: Ig-like domain-containing protein [Planctomycetota bacterium]|nr:Ig-like domain-containing protein [Planctomycetota bacterium]